MNILLIYRKRYKIVAEETEENQLVVIAPGSRVKDDGSMSALILKLLMKLESCNIFSLDIISFDRNNQRKDQVYRGANYLRLID